MIRKKSGSIKDLLLAIVIMVAVAGLLIEVLPWTGLTLSNLPEPLSLVLRSLMITFLGTLFLLIKCPVELSHFGFAKTEFRKTLVCGVVGGLFVSFIQFPYDIVAGKSKIASDVFLGPHEGAGFVLVFLVVVVIIIPVVEEVFHRPYVFRIVKSRFGSLWGYVVSTVLFVFGHDISSYKTVALVCASSVILTFVYDRSKSIGTSIIAHGLWNATWYTAVYWKAW